MTHLGTLHHFIGISVTRSSDGLFLSQRQYAVKLLQRVGMSMCHPSTTPQVCLFVHGPREPHLALVKHILCYVKGTLSTGLHIGTGHVQSLTAYSNMDWAGCPNSRRSTLGYCVYIGDNLVSWSFKHQDIVSRSSVEAEYRAITHCWLRQLV
ncbi:uncharacterized mitochondrial protein AtMg00810-like [Miscanthus floridulus]|uniref:uncharacterized mitochondrial protein AtMg00810-like n=1 Tax=Miscanthus floridulus TaxID=154761 RepID=UPI0034580B0D